MYTLDDFWKVLDFLSGESVTDLPEVITSIAKSEQASSESFFSSIIDQLPFDTNDYTRLRDFLIDWYSSFKTFLSAESQVSDPHSLPNTHLDELFRSFGYLFSQDLTVEPLKVNSNKVNFFLDLVNLYKVKGTPALFIPLLQYYGLKDVDIYEYTVKKDQFGTLIFEAKYVTGTTNIKPVIEVPFPSVIYDDPHWFLTKQQILDLDARSHINLPDKSPYFSFRPRHEIGIVVAQVERIVQDQYEEYINTGTITRQDAEITWLGLTVSLLELYLTCIYIFNITYETGIAPNHPFFCYDGTSTTFADIEDEYNDIVQVPTTRADRKARLLQFEDVFTRPQSSNFFVDRNTARDVLNIINPSLRSAILSEYVTEVEEGSVLNSLLEDLWQWVRLNIGLGTLNIVYLILGNTAFSRDLGDMINFFKPYRARPLPLELIDFNNPLADSIRVEDLDDFFITIEQSVIDFLTCDSAPCCQFPEIECMDSTASYYSRLTYDCGSYYDVGAVCDKNEFYIYIEDVIYQLIICLPPGDTCIHSGKQIVDPTIVDATAIIPLYVHTITDGTSTIHIDSTSNIVYMWQDSGFCEFDEEGIFDCLTGFDTCHIFVEDKDLATGEWISYVDYWKYPYPFGGIPFYPTVTIDPLGGVFDSTATLTITMSSYPGSNIYYTTDGSEPDSSSTLYSGPFSLTGLGQITLKAIAIRLGEEGPVNTQNYYFVPEVSIIPNGGIFDSTAIVELSAPAFSSDIYYTTDGSDPDEFSTLYTGPFTITETGTTTTVKAAIIVSGVVGRISEADFTVVTANDLIVDFDPLSGFYDATAGVSVELTSFTGADIYYTTDGSTPDMASTLYTVPIELSGIQTTTIKARAFIDGIHGPVGSETYTLITENNLEVTFDPLGGTYDATSGVSVELTSYPGASIRYTTNGTNPTIFSPLYTAPIELTGVQTTEIRARAYANGLFGPIGSETYDLVEQNMLEVIFDPLGGYYDSTAGVSIELTSYPGADIYYTTDGSTPDTTSTLYVSPIILSGESTTTIKAKAFIDDLEGPIGIETYYLIPNSDLEVLFNPPGGIFDSTAEVTITLTSLPVASIYYTINGSIPTKSSTMYTGPFTITGPDLITVRARAFVDDLVGPIASYDFDFVSQEELTVIFNPPGIAFDTTADIELTSYPGADIYYTTDGSTPDTTSTLYVSPITIYEDTTIKARAFINGLSGPIGIETYEKVEGDAFIFTIETNSETFTLPLESTGVYDFTIDWGDTSYDNITSWDQSEVSHTYESAGTYTIKIWGTIQGWRFNFNENAVMMREIKNWGPLKLGG